MAEAIAIRSNGGCTFAERPDVEAPDANIIWHADVDPATLPVRAIPVECTGGDHIDLQSLAPWLSIAIDDNGHEHAVISDGWHHVRIDVEAGSLSRGGLVLLEYRLAGLASAQLRLQTLNRFIQFAIHHRFTKSQYRNEARMSRWITLLRVWDALRAGASQREIGRALFGASRVDRDWNGPSDSLRSRVRRLVAEARALGGGGYRRLLMRSAKTRSPRN